MNPIVIAVIVVSVTGVLCAVMLAIADKFMSVKVDERIPAVRECLPGANCGGCGFPGCDGYAAALVEDPDLACNLCAAGGAAAAQAVAAVLGRDAGDVVAKAAVVRCKGDCNVTENKHDYQGVESCAAAKLLYGGTGSCIYGCLGIGDCAKVCPQDAIYIKDGIARVYAPACIACGKCTKVCPNGLIMIKPVEKNVVVKCSNKEKGVMTGKHCKAGCIGCGLCAKNCPVGAITVTNNVASIDYEKCISCGKCAEVCPKKCIAL